MQTPSNELRNALVTQKSKRQPLIYDRIQSSINETITTLKAALKNAIVRNLVYNIDGQLVIAQLFINRLNGFVPTEEAKFGTTPTAYNIQLRFVHGYETVLGSDPIFISNGSFAWNNLVPRQIEDYIVDDVYHEMTVIPGPQVNVMPTPKVLSFNIPGTESISLPSSTELGKGYVEYSTSGPKYYANMHDYQMRHKFNAVYALWYLQPEHNEILRWHPEYQGHTLAHGEPRDHMASARKQTYQDWTQQISTSLQQHSLSNQWITYQQRSRLENNTYRLDMLSVNGMILYSDTGLVVDRLYDYQVELNQLFTTVYQSIRGTNQPGRLPQDVHTSIVDMGVGAGKTYIINTVLKSISRFYQDRNFAPAFCMTPDPALAQVMVRVINKQTGVAQIISNAITSSADIPNATFLQRYQRYAQTAVGEIQTIKTYVFAGLQNNILEYCRQFGLHPFVIMNELYNDPVMSCQLYQNSIDIKRLLLLIEGQKLIVQKTGLSPVIALRRLSDELEKIIQGVNKEQANNNPLFAGIDQPINLLYPPKTAQIVYDRMVELPLSLRSNTLSQINFKEMTPAVLRRLLMQKFSYKHNLLQKSVSIRDVLLKIACLSDARAAILLANGGGLANTHTLDQIKDQIEFLLEPAALELQRGAQQENPMSYLEHRTYFLYLNEIFATMPSEIDARRRYGCGHEILVMSLRLNYQLLHQLRAAIQQQLTQMTPSQDIDQHYGPTMVEAANQMAGEVGLVLSGRLEGDAAKLLSTHVPVFTPEGFVAYLEYLVSCEGQERYQVQYHEGIYLLESSNTGISRQLIQQRLVQVFSAILVADEIHKDTYQFLYDPTHSLYQRANFICQTYLNQKFGDILPHRIGMSGTVNQIAKSAFGPEILYSLPLQDMIQRQLTKQFKVKSLAVAQSTGIQNDYFLSNAWWNIAKGIVFSKQPLSNLDLNDLAPSTDSPVPMQALRDQLFVHYLEFLLQKSGASKELSEIVGIQNTLFAKKVSLLDAFQNAQDYDHILQDTIGSIRNVSPDLIAETDVRHYVQRCIHDPSLQHSLAELIMQCKNDYRAMCRALANIRVALNEFTTRDPLAFEDGLSQVLIGSEAQQTGYSHEFVGAIVDASNWALSMPTEKFEGSADTDLHAFYQQLQQLRMHSFSYDEKNQIGGRALRTSSGTAHYLEYLSPNYDRAFLFNIETSFSDILLEDKAQAKLLRASVSCNRMLLAQLEEFEGSLDAFVSQVVAHCQSQHVLEDFRSLLPERLPAWWMLKCQAKLLSQEESVVLGRMVMGQLPPIQIAECNRKSRKPLMAVNNFGPTSAYAAATWLQWMAQSSVPITVGAILLIAGLSTLGAVSLGFVASTLLLNYGAVGLTVVGSALLVPVLSKSYLAFFQQPPVGHDLGRTGEQPESWLNLGIPPR